MMQNAARQETSRRELLKMARRLAVGGFVGQPAEHHMGHAPELVARGGEKCRVVVAVHRRPPARDAVDELAAVFEQNARAPRRAHGNRRGHGFHLGVGEPDVLDTQVEPVGAR